MHRIKKVFLAKGDFILPCVTSVLFSMLGAPFLAMVKYVCSFWFQCCGLLERLWNWPSNYSEVINVFCTKAEVCLFFSLYKPYCWYNLSPSKSKCKWFFDWKERRIRENITGQYSNLNPKNYCDTKNLQSFEISLTPLLISTLQFVNPMFKPRQNGPKSEIGN